MFSPRPLSIHSTPWPLSPKHSVGLVSPHYPARTRRVPAGDRAHASWVTGVHGEWRGWERAEQGGLWEEVTLGWRGEEEQELAGRGRGRGGNGGAWGGISECEVQVGRAGTILLGAERSPDAGAESGRGREWSDERRDW